MLTINNKKMLIMLGCCLIFFGAIFSYKFIGKIIMHFHFNHMSAPTVTITTTNVKQFDWVSALESVGTVQAINSVDVTTEAAGVVEFIRFQSGDNVAVGDVLLGLNSKADHAKLEALKAAMKLTEQSLSRTQQLIKAGNTSRAELDLKQSEADQASAQVAAQQELLEQKTIRAPFDGKLGIRKVNLGEYISPGRAIVNLQSLDPIYVNFSIPEQDLYSIKCDLNVDIKVPALKNEIFTGKIIAIEPGADATTRNFNVQAIFENKDFKLRQGMFAEVSIKLPTSVQVIAIPRTAIHYNPYGNSVYVVQPIKDTTNNKEEFIVKRRFIKLGSNQQDLVAIVDGLIAGDIVATSGLLKLNNNSKVVVNNSIIPDAEAGTYEVH